MEESFNDITDLIQYYRKPKEEINKTVDNRVFLSLRGYSEETREKIINWLFANRPKNYGLDIPAINEAIKETGSGAAASEYVPAIKLKCDACQMEYQWVQITNDAMKHDKGLHETCPRCGLPGIDQIEAGRYADQREGNQPDWYTRLKSRCVEEHMGLDKMNQSKPWHYDRALDDNAERQAHKAKVERIKAEAVRTLDEERTHKAMGAKINGVGSTQTPDPVLLGIY